MRLEKNGRLRPWMQLAEFEILADDTTRAVKSQLSEDVTAPVRAARRRMTRPEL